MSWIGMAMDNRPGENRKKKSEQRKTNRPTGMCGNKEGQLPDK